MKTSSGSWALTMGLRGQGWAGLGVIWDSQGPEPLWGEWRKALSLSWVLQVCFRVPSLTAVPQAACGVYGGRGSVDRGFILL